MRKDNQLTFQLCILRWHPVKLTLDFKVSLRLRNTIIIQDRSEPGQSGPYKLLVTSTNQLLNMHIILNFGYNVSSMLQKKGGNSREKKCEENVPSFFKAYKKICRERGEERETGNCEWVREKNGSKNMGDKEGGSYLSIWVLSYLYKKGLSNSGVNFQHLYMLRS